MADCAVGHLRPIYSLAFSPQGGTLASGSNRRSLNLRLAVRHTLSAHSKEVTSVTFSPQVVHLPVGVGMDNQAMESGYWGSVPYSLGSSTSGYVRQFQP